MDATQALSIPEIVDWLKSKQSEGELTGIVIDAKNVKRELAFFERVDLINSYPIDEKNCKSRYMYELNSGKLDLMNISIKELLAETD